MTREEVMALSDEELRIKTAELLGWGSIVSQTFPSGYTVISGARPGTTGPVVLLPDYPHDIAAATELWFGSHPVVHLRRLSPGFSGCAAEYIRHESGKTFTHVVYEPKREQDDEPRNIAARATTRAFVLAMTQEENHGDA